MPLNLEVVDQTLLSHSPLANVVCQVRFEPAIGASARAISDLRERLGGEATFPKIERIGQGQFAVMIGQGRPPVPPPTPQATRGWRILNESGSRVVALFPTAVAFEVFDYNGWDQDFAPTLREVLAAVSDLGDPVFEQRIGLRYTNQLKTPDDVQDPAGWRGLIDPSFLSLASHDEIGDHVKVTRQQTLLELDDGVRCNVNQGFAPDDDRDGALTYVLDFDVFREGLRPFDPDGIAAVADRFNLVALRLFQLATTDDLRSRLS